MNSFLLFQPVSRTLAAQASPARCTLPRLEVDEHDTSAKLKEFQLVDANEFDVYEAILL